ncbi:hypothetical protein GCM10009818_32390 [Nakamurella flavida]
MVGGSSAWADADEVDVDGAVTDTASVAGPEVHPVRTRLSTGRRSQRWCPRDRRGRTDRRRTAADVTGDGEDGEDGEDGDTDGLSDRGGRGPPPPL